MLAIVNVVGSSIARESDDVIYTWAGPETAVATTKGYTTQIVCAVPDCAVFRKGARHNDRRSLYRGSEGAA